MIVQRHIVLIFLVFTALAQTATGQPVVEGERLSLYPIERPLGYERSVAQGTRTEDGRPGENYWQQFATYDIQARLMPDERRVEASVQIIYQNNSPDTLTQLHLDLYQNLHREGGARLDEAEVTGGVALHRVAVDGAEIQQDNFRGPQYVVRGTRLLMIPPSPLAPQASVSIEIDWSFTVPQQGAGERMGYSDDNMFFIGYWYPQMTVYDDVVGWHPDQFMGRAEFYHGFGDYALSIEAPGDWIVMGTGDFLNPEETLAPAVLARYRRAGESDEKVEIVTANDFGIAATAAGDPSETLTWRFHAESVRDVAFSATRESLWDGARTSVGDRNGDGTEDFTRINTFYRELAPLWSEVTRYQQHAISFLSEFTGFPYPWPHMTAVEGSTIVGGGMEFPMMTIMGDYNMRGPDALYSVTAHELAHMWVPMIVSTDERRYSWLDEGNTSFSTDAAKMDFQPGIDHHEMTRRQYINFARAGMEGPIMRRSDHHYTYMAYGVASYHKPATVLAALRGVLGEEVFNEAYQTFINTWAFRQAYPWDMFATFERVSGRDLSWFWRTWYYETWVMNQAIAEVAEEDGQTRIVIEDRGEAPMPVHLTLTLEDGSRVTEVIPVDVWLEGATHVTHFVSHTGLQRIEIDQARDFPDIITGNQVWQAPPATN